MPHCHERRRPTVSAPALLFWLTIFILHLLVSG